MFTFLSLLNASQIIEVNRRIDADIVAAAPYFIAWDNRMLAGMREEHARKVWLGL